METFAPTMVLDGKTVTPKGYAWVLGFALAGCEWAILEAGKPEFLERIKSDLTREKVAQLERVIKQYEQKIGECKKTRDDLIR